MGVGTAMTAPDVDDEAAWAEWRSAWSIDRAITYLNHGSFGPPPTAVAKARDDWSAQLAANPMDFFVRRLGEILTSARTSLAGFVGTSADNLLLVDNATSGMNIVAESFPLAAGDEVLTTDHDYGAVLRIWQRACDKAGAKLVVRSVPVPVSSEEELIEAVLEGVTDRTRLLVFSHITSPTAIIFPAVALTRAARERGLAVCIDGPHAIAQIAVDLDVLDCDYYTASCHKWLSAPFGSGFLYVHPRRQSQMRPSVVSWGRSLIGDEPSWRDEFNWQGTRDPAAHLATAAAIDFLTRVGLEAFRARTHYLARLASAWIGGLTGLAPLVPDTTGWYGSMIALPLPAGEAEPLQAALWDRHQIEVPVVAWQGRRLIRVSCHLYTQAAEIERLASALKGLL